MNTIDLGYVIPGAYSGLSRIRGCSSLCCTDQASVGALETNEPSVAPTKLRLVHLRQVHPLQDAMPHRDTKKRSPKSFDSEDLSKEGSHLLSRIALQYHRRKRA